MYLSIDYKFTNFFGKDRDYLKDDFIDDIFFNIYDSNKNMVGEGNLMILDFVKLTNYHYELGFDFFEFLDSDSEIINLFQDISTSEFMLNAFYDCFLYEPFFIEKFPDGFMRENVGYLKRLNIFKEFQGLNIGSMVLEILQEKFLNDVDFIAVKPYPLEFSEKSSEEFIQEDFNLKKQKVINFYKKNGYQKIHESDYYMLIS